jgi:hypothetical protein
MNELSKIDFRYRRINQLDDITDHVALLFPSNRNQQHAAARILLTLKAADGLLPSLSFLEERHGISRRTLQRVRAKLARIGAIEYVTWMSSRHNGQQGWKLSSRMSGALRQYADKLDRWRHDHRPERAAKDQTLTGLLR